MNTLVCQLFLLGIILVGVLLRGAGDAMLHSAVLTFSGNQACRYNGLPVCSVNRAGGAVQFGFTSRAVGKNKKHVSKNMKLKVGADDQGQD